VDIVDHIQIKRATAQPRIQSGLIDYPGKRPKGPRFAAVVSKFLSSLSKSPSDVQLWERSIREAKLKHSETKVVPFFCGRLRLFECMGKEGFTFVLTPGAADKEATERGSKPIPSMSESIPFPMASTWADICPNLSLFLENWAIFTSKGPSFPREPSGPVRNWFENAKFDVVSFMFASALSDGLLEATFDGSMGIRRFFCDHWSIFRESANGTWIPLYRK